MSCNPEFDEEDLWVSETNAACEKTWMEFSRSPETKIKSRCSTWWQKGREDGRNKRFAVKRQVVWWGEQVLIIKCYGLILLQLTESNVCSMFFPNVISKSHSYIQIYKYSRISLLLTFTNSCQRLFSPASRFILSLNELSPILHQAAPASTVHFLNAHIEFFPFLFSASSLDRW